MQIVIAVYAIALVVAFAVILIVVLTHHRGTPRAAVAGADSKHISALAKAPITVTEAQRRQEVAMLEASWKLESANPIAGDSR
jgi:hypothetical protein